ncbi:NADP-dependent oxidoreductase [Pseudomonas sp. B329]|uniref:NADP-dependent oxidoreductase n=1 Tax=Pseudomonas sp. B329 TaxID=1553459 RepID=UPI0020057ED5|nr:NADP-dependent oxidoreductase [Pseudomonas sp. B329]MCK3866135.1 NADP-dependent oxidoreductase [Pseudomonas sp. B329]
MRQPSTQTKPELSTAALIYEYGGSEQLRVEKIEIGLPGPGEVRVRVAAAAVNPFDINLRQGFLQAFVPLVFPACLGSDVSGIVDAVGEGVVGLVPGDQVIGMLTTGAYSQWAITQASLLVILPDGIDLCHAAALPTGVLTGVQLIERGLKPRAGSKVLVAGAGGSVGRAAVFAAKDLGALVYAGIRPGSRDAVADLPVAGVIDLSDDVALQAAGPFDYVADTVGGGVAERLFAHLSASGYFASTVLPFINPPADAIERFTPVIVEFDGPRLQRFARELVAKGRKILVSSVLNLADVAQAHVLLARGGLQGKIVLKP